MLLQKLSFSLQSQFLRTPRHVLFVKRRIRTGQFLLRLVSILRRQSILRDPPQAFRSHDSTGWPQNRRHFAHIFRTSKPILHYFCQLKLVKLASVFVYLFFHSVSTVTQINRAFSRRQHSKRPHFWATTESSDRTMDLNGVPFLGSLASLWSDI